MWTNAFHLICLARVHLMIDEQAIGGNGDGDHDHTCKSSSNSEKMKKTSHKAKVYNRVLLLPSKVQ